MAPDFEHLARRPCPIAFLGAGHADSGLPKAARVMLTFKP